MSHTVTGLAGALPLMRGRALTPRVGDGLLGLLFVALACSVTLSQVLLVLLALLPLYLWSRGEAAPWSDLGALRRHPLTPPLLWFVGLSMVSALTSGDALGSLQMTRDVLRIGVFYLVLVYTRDADHASRLWRAFLVTLCVMAVYGLGQAYLCGGRPALAPTAWLAAACAHPSRVSGPFSIYMTFSGVLLIGAVFILAHLANLSWRRLLWLAPAGALAVAALALTQSRNAWLGLAAGSVLVAALARRAARLAIALVTVVLLVALLSPASVTDRLRSMRDLQDETVRDRIAMWQAGLAMIADHPWLGVGPGQVRVWYYAQYRVPEAVRPSTGHLHNSPIHIAAERGIPALAVWLWLWVAFFRAAGRVLRRLGRHHRHERALVCASLGGVAGFLVAGLFEHNFGDSEVVMLVYALMALPFAVARGLQGHPEADPAVADSAGSAQG